MLTAGLVSKHVFMLAQYFMAQHENPNRRHVFFGHVSETNDAFLTQKSHYYSFRFVLPLLPTLFNFPQQTIRFLAGACRLES